MVADQFPRYSGMNFVPDNVFVIEDSRIRASVGEKVRSVEFIRRKGSNLLFIEAKSTFANPADSPIPYKEEVTEVCEKFIHTLNLLSSIKTGVTDAVLPPEFDYKPLVTISFVLVIRRHKTNWCRPIRRELEQMLPVYVKKIWRPSVFVINCETAKKFNLIR